LCDLVLPDLHTLETWVDAESMRGVVTLQQPAMTGVRRYAVDRRCSDRVAKTIRRSRRGILTPTYRTWLFTPLPGAATRRRRDGVARGIAAGSILARAAQPATAIAAHSGGCRRNWRLPPRHVSVADARRTAAPTAVLQELPDRSRGPVELVGRAASGGRAALGVERGDIVEVKTATGSVAFRHPSISACGRTPSPSRLGRAHSRRRRTKV